MNEKGMTNKELEVKQEFLLKRFDLLPYYQIFIWFLPKYN